MSYSFQRDRWPRKWIRVFRIITNFRKSPVLQNRMYYKRNNHNASVWCSFSISNNKATIVSFFSIRDKNYNIRNLSKFILIKPYKSIAFLCSNYYLIHIFKLYWWLTSVENSNISEITFVSVSLIRILNKGLRYSTLEFLACELNWIQITNYNFTLRKQISKCYELQDITRHYSKVY